jgi:hypothetical protein
MRVLVCGSRTFKDERLIKTTLNGWFLTNILEGPFIVIEGGAEGADRIAHEWAETVEGVNLLTFPAKWEEHGRAAGPIRNKQMLVEGKPELVLAFVDKPLIESRGTLDMVTRSEEAGLPTYVHEAL